MKGVEMANAQKKKRKKHLSLRIFTALEAAELAARTGNSIGTLKNWRIYGGGPSFIKRGGRIFYPLAEVEKWERARDRLRHSTREPDHA